MQIPFKRTSKSVKHTNKSRNKVLRFVHLIKHAKDDASDSLKKTVQKRTIFQKEKAQFLVNGKNTMTMDTVDKFKRHTGRAFLRIFHATGRTETAVTTKRNKFHVVTIWTDIHAPPKEGSPQLIIFSILSSSDVLGCKLYLIFS